ncbi:hypothetical protein CCAX7_22490 [Capsulimonas corticalis]|uniref:Uncharacterized protein n=1 Tax=Capsulimonas corticalis TaxID=2219043 RepID=A0A402D2B6_9BACT|nr:helix-turn-helix transcriptional regulator [Capsulimonas corticalis]BDI30198.1 hypothetical protein CCAX7_22490 [Capsulimonas corticalis]
MDMQEAFSRLKRVLDAQGLNTADLVRRVAEQGDRINAKSIYRLADPEEPLEKVDMRVIGAVCQALGIGIADILTFDEPTIVEDLGAAKQARMDALMARHSERSGPGLTAAELTELEKLVGEAETIALGNARRLAARRRRLLRAPRRPQPAADSSHTAE